MLYQRKPLPFHGENMKTLILSSCFLFLFIQKSSAEVERIMISWNTIICDGACNQRVKASLQKIKPVIDVQINDNQGVANLLWDSRYPFEYDPFRFAAGEAGIRFNDMRLKVKGKIVSNEKNIFLISDIDSAQFLLIGPTKIDPYRYVVPNNIISHPIPPRMEAQLLNARDLNQTVLVSGPLFLPRSYDRTLIIEQIQILEESSRKHR